MGDIAPVMDYFIVVAIVIGIGLFISGLCEIYEAKIGHLASRFIKFAAGFLSVAALVLVCLTFLSGQFFGFWEDMCGDSISQSISSPGGTFIATVFSRDCGAVTSSREIVPILLLGDRWHPIQFKNSHIIWRRDWIGREINDVVFSGTSDDTVELTWLTNNHLLVKLPAKSISIGDLSWENVKISYRHTRK